MTSTSQRRDFLDAQPPAEFLGKLGRIRYWQNAEGYTICSYWWPATQTPKAVILLVHGHCSYLAYEYLAFQRPGAPNTYAGSWVEALNAQGFSVCGLDLQGCGRSEGLRGYVDRFDCYVEDVLQLARMVGRCGLDSFEQLPMFLCADSLGGCISVNAAMRASELFRGVVLLAPMLSLEKASSKGLNPYLRPVAGLISWLAPTLPIAAANKNTMFPLMQEAWEADPVVYNGLTRARNATEYLRACERTSRALHSITFPFLVFHSEKDTMTDIDGSKALYQKAKSPDKTLRLVNNMWHILCKEDGNEAVLQEIIAWISERLPVQRAQLPNPS